MGGALLSSSLMSTAPPLGVTASSFSPTDSPTASRWRQRGRTGEAMDDDGERGRVREEGRAGGEQGSLLSISEEDREDSEEGGDTDEGGVEARERERARDG